MDNRFVDLCGAIPRWERTQPGKFKPLAHTAYTGLVLDVLLERRTKTSFTGSLYDGLRAHSPAVRRILSVSTLVQVGLLDRSRRWTRSTPGFVGRRSRWQHCTA
ncbi:asparagine synthase-related protein [Streptomyces sp. NPDC002526]